MLVTDVQSSYVLSQGNGIVHRLRSYTGPLLMALCAAILIAQVLVRPAIGLADNGDFPKMAGPLGLGPEDGSWDSHDAFGEFIYRFVKADRYNWQREFVRAEFLSSEYFFIKLARGVQKIVDPGPRFDIRWLGGVTGIVFLLPIGIWIYALPVRWRLLAGVFVVLVWSDSAYVQYLNSFYMDAAAMVFFVLLVAAAMHLIKNRQSRIFALVTAAAAILFAVSKSQHAIPALVLVPLLWAFALWSPDRVVRITLVAGSLILIAGAFLVVSRVTSAWTGHNVFNVVFLDIVPASSDPVRTLQELGLGRDELPLVGTHAYQADSPMANQQWAEAFYARCNYRTLLLYYAHHPVATARLVYRRMELSAPHVRPWGNLAREDGFEGRAQSTHFNWWSDFRSYLFSRAPWYAFALELVAIAAAFRLLGGAPQDQAFAALLLAIQLVALLECAGSILADGVETERHLFLFHVATDATILLMPALVWRIVTRHRRATVSAAAGDYS